jgi:hypothetical protein
MKKKTKTSGFRRKSIQSIQKMKNSAKKCGSDRSEKWIGRKNRNIRRKRKRSIFDREMESASDAGAPGGTGKKWRFAKAGNNGRKVGIFDVCEKGLESDEFFQRVHWRGSGKNGEDGEGMGRKDWV